MTRYLSKAQGSVKGSSGNKADLEAMGQAHISAVAGACLSIGIKFAGSADAAAERVLRHYVLYFLNARQQAPDSASGQLSLGFRCAWGGGGKVASEGGNSITLMFLGPQNPPAGTQQALCLMLQLCTTPAMCEA